jgi:hypothetical protein
VAAEGEGGGSVGLIREPLLHAWRLKVKAAQAA